MKTPEQVQEAIDALDKVIDSREEINRATAASPSERLHKELDDDVFADALKWCEALEWVAGAAPENNLDILLAKLGIK